jgi:hypothetical protein
MTKTYFRVDVFRPLQLVESDDEVWRRGLGLPMSEMEARNFYDEKKKIGSHLKFRLITVTDEIISTSQ